MKKILVPTDYTTTAENAVETARMLAKKNDAEVVFLNVIEIDSGEAINTSGGPSNYASFTDGVLIHESIKQSEKEMKQLLEVSNLQGVKSSSVIKMGNPFHHIFAAVEELGIDLIIMGTKGASGLSEILIGSNTEKVVRKAKCPVLSIKDALNENDFDQLVYATNFGDNEAGVVAAIKELQAIFNSKIRLVWINTPNDFKSDATTRPLLDKFVKEYALENCTTHVYSDIIAEDGIRNFAEYMNAQLIVMGTNSFTGLSRLIRGSVAEDMINHAERPVLTVSMKE